MKQKIFVLTLCFTFLFNSLSFADNHSHEEVLSYNTKSGTVAISLGVVNALLPLAVKAGFEFKDSKSMDEFIYRFLSLDNASEIVGAIGSQLNNIKDGVVTFSSSLIQSISSAFSKLDEGKKVNFVEADGVRIPLVTQTNYPDTDYKLNLIKNVPSSLKVWTDNPTTKTFKSIGSYTSSLTSTNKYPENGATIELRCNSTSTSACKYDGMGGLNNYQEGYSYWGVPVIYLDGNARYNLGYITAGTYKGKWMTSTTFSFCTSHRTTNKKDYIDRTMNVALGSGWSSGAIIGDDGTVGSDTSIPITQTPSQLVGLGSSDVDVSNPGYDVWQPGQVINPPSTDTPSVEYDEPEIDIPSDEDTPGDEGEGEGNGSTWDWLKKLIQSIVKILENIWSWITSFWDMLTNILSIALSGIVDILTNIWNWTKEFWNTFTKTLGDILSSIFSNIFEFFESFWETLREFIEGLFVPKETYWTDKVTEVNKTINNKYPTVNIDKLEQLAVGEKKFEDIYANFFGQKCLVVRASLVNNIIGWARPIIQGLLCIFLLLYNYNNLYKLLRNGTLTSPSESSHKK